jgi:hypothetical protein
MRRHLGRGAGREEHLRSFEGLERINSKPATRLGKEFSRQDEVEKSRTKLVGQNAAPLDVEPRPSDPRSPSKITNQPAQGSAR